MNINGYRSSQIYRELLLIVVKIVETMTKNQTLQEISLDDSKFFKTFFTLTILYKNKFEKSEKCNLGICQ